MEKVISEFGVQPILLAAQVVNFLVLLFILNKLLYKPLLKVLQERKAKIAQSLEQAQEIEEKLAKTEEEREAKLVKAGEEARAILEEATKNATQIIAEAHQKAQTDIDGMIDKGQEEIKLEREKMYQEFREEVADIVVAGLQKVTGKVIDKKDQKELVEKSVKGMV